MSGVRLLSNSANHALCWTHAAGVTGEGNHPHIYLFVLFHQNPFMLPSKLIRVLGVQIWPYSALCWSTGGTYCIYCLTCLGGLFLSVFGLMISCFHISSLLSALNEK